MCNSKINSTPESKPLYDSRCDETSATVSCAAAAASAASAAASAAPARGIRCISHRAEASTETDCYFGNVIMPRGIILSILQIINRSIDQTDAHGIWRGFNHI